MFINARGGRHAEPHLAKIYAPCGRRALGGGHRMGDGSAGRLRLRRRHVVGDDAAGTSAVRGGRGCPARARNRESTS